MSLIADALKAAQHEKMQRVPAPAGSAPGGFFSVRSGQRSRDAIPRPVLYTLVGVGAVGVVVALVTLLMASSKPVAQVAAEPPPVVQPVVNLTPTSPTAAGAFSNAPPVLTESASAVPAPVPQAAVPASQPPAPAPLPVSDQTAVKSPVKQVTVASGSTAGATPATRTGDTTRASLGDSMAVAALPTKRPGTLRITMEQRPVTDIQPLFQQALAAQRRGDVARAKELYLKALERDPQNADLHNNIGTLYRSTGELDRAEAAYRHAISLNPKLAAAWSNLGVVLDALGRKREATAALQQAIAIDPSNVDSKVNLALQYHAAGLYADAKRLLEEAIRANPTMPEAHYALARTLEAQGDRNSAIQQYDLFLSTSNGRFTQLERQVTQHLALLRGGS